MGQAVVDLKIKTKAGCEDLEPPAYMSDGASGFDVRAAVGEPLVLAPGDREVIPTGLLMEIPRGYEAQTRPRSGLAARHGITIVNSPGTIDSDYRGEVKIILANTGRDPFTVERGMRIAQVVVAPVARVRIVPAAELSETKRGAGGFGHTGQ